MSAATSGPGSVQTPASSMEKLSPLVSVYRPSENASTNADHQPRLIIVASWTDARDVHIAKYISKYQALYPAAQILLLKSTMSCIVRPSQIGPAMKVAASIVRAAFPTTPQASSYPTLLVHVFSNGGSSSMAALYKQFAATALPDQEKRLPPHVTIFDSAPGLFRMPEAVAFVSVGLPGIQKLIAAPFLYAFAAFWTLCMTIGLIPNAMRDWYTSHNEDPGNSTELRRVYIYSPIDALIQYKDVEAHAAEAKRKGFSVSLEKYEKSAHVSHVRKDENRYWEIVRKAMEA